MATTVDQLNFEVILDDKKFNRAITSAINRANQLNTQLTNILNMQNKVSNAADNLRDKMNGTTTTAEKLRDSIVKVFSIETLASFTKQLITITGEFQKQQVALRAILQDTAGADALFEQIKQLAVISPFSVLDLTSYAKQLSAFSIPLDELYDTTKMLADVSAGLGVDMSRIVLAYGQIRSASFLRGQEVRQLTEAGIPILQQLSQQFTEIEGKAVSVGEVFERISARQVPFEMVEKAFRDMTSEGGKFYQMQEVLSETLAGKISNLKDSWEIMLSNLGNSSDGILKGSINTLTALINNYRILLSVIATLVTAYGAYKIAALAVGAAEYKNFLVTRTWTPGLKSMAKAYQSLHKSLLAAQGSLKAFAIQMKAMSTSAAGILGIIATIVVALGTLALALYNTNKARNKIIETMTKVSNGMSGEIKNLNDYVETLKEAEKGTNRYEEAKRNLFELSEKYNAGLTEESLEVDNLKDSYDRLRASITKASKERAIEEGLSTADEQFDKSSKRLQKQFANAIDRARKNYNLTDEEEEMLADLLYRGKAIPDDKDRLLFEKDILSVNETGQEYTYKLPITLKNYLSNQFEDLVSKFKSLTEERDEAYATVRKQADQLFGKEAETASIEETELQKLLNGLLEPFGNFAMKGQIKYDPSKESWSEYVDKIRTAYQDAKDALSKLPNDKSTDELRGQYKELIEAIEALESGLPANADGSKIYLTKGKTTNKLNAIENAEKKEHDRLKSILSDRAKDLEDFRKKYNDLAELGENDETIATKFREWFPEDEDLWGGFNFKEKAEKMAQEMESVFADSDAAKDIRQRFGLEAFDEYKKKLKELTKILEEWEERKTDLDDEALDIETNEPVAKLKLLLNKLSKQNSDLDNRLEGYLSDLENAKAAYVEKYGIEKWNDYYSEAQSTIAKVKELLKSAQKATTQDRTNELANDVVDNLFINNDINTSDLERKSLADIRREYEKIKGLIEQGGIANLIPSEVKTKADELGISLDELIKQVDLLLEKEADAAKEASKGLSIDQIFDARRTSSFNDVFKTLDNISTLKKKIEYAYKTGSPEAAVDYEKQLEAEQQRLNEQFKSAGMYATSIGGALGTAAEKMRELADATGDVELGEMAEMVGSFAQNLNAAGEGAASGGWIGAIVGGVTDIINQTIDGIISAKLYVEQLNQSIKDFQNQLLLNSLSVDEDAYDTIFGTKSIAKTIDAYDKAQKSLKEYNDYVNAAMEEPELKKKKINWGAAIFLSPLDEGTYWAGWAGNKLAEEEQYTQKSLKQYEAYVKGYTQLQGMMVKTKDYSGWQELWGKEDKYTALKDLAPGIWDEDGNFNVDNAQAFLDSSKQLTDEQRKQLELAIDLKTAYDEAMESIEDTLSDLYSDIASDITDIIFDSVINGADAWDDFHEKGAEVILSLGKQLLQELMISSFLEKYKDRMIDAYGNSDITTAQKELRSITKEMFNAMDGYVSTWSDIAEEWVEYMKDAGYDPTESSDSLSNGIKSITEDTADLLASYINAIRSDVSQIRVMQSNASANLEQIVASLPKAPTLAEYLTQIEAHTANIATDTNSILKQLKSVVTTQGGSAAFNVYMS